MTRPPSPQRKSSRYRVGITRSDPDLADGALKWAIMEADAEVTGHGLPQSKTQVSDHGCAAVIHCIGRKCNSATLAYVWQTSLGLLFRSVLVFAHDHPLTRPDVSFLTMRHPDVAGPATTTAEAYQGFHKDKGWQLCPAEPLPRHQRSQVGVLVRDLITSELPGHPPLRVKCPRDGEAVVNRLLLLAELAQRGKRATARPLHIPLSAVL